MTYYIKCKTFRQALISSAAFAKHYSNNDVSIVKRRTEVQIDGNKFVFINENDPRSTMGIRGEVIPHDTFAKKYFTQN